MSHILYLILSRFYCEFRVQSLNTDTPSTRVAMQMGSLSKAQLDLDTCEADDARMLNSSETA
jgi:hypothetical protein